MGLSWRKRTKGKNLWVNLFASKNNGAGASLSLKIGNATANLGPNGRKRLTINFGNGIRYIKTSTASKKVKPSQKPQATYDKKIVSNIEPIVVDEKYNRMLFWLFVVLVASMCFIVQLVIR